MTTELPLNSLPRDPSQVPSPELPIEPGDVEALLPKGHAASVATIAAEKKLEMIKQFRNYKFGKNALKVKGARNRGDSLRIERARPSGSRRKQP